MPPKTLTVDIEPLTLPSSQQELEELVLSLDINFPTKPLKNGKEYTPELPNHLSEQPPHVVAQTLQELSEYKAYLMGRCATANVLVDNLKLIVEYKELSFRQTLTGTEKHKDTLVKLDRDILKWKERFQQAKNEAKLAKACLEVAETRVKTASRIIALMEQEVISGARTHNVQRTTSQNILARIRATKR